MLGVTMKILIADDERLVRFSLKSMLEEMGISSRSLSMARDGEEMLEAVRRASPDVAFVDIKMPRRDGLDAIEEARAFSPGTRWVVLTSHSSFDFARRALQLGVVEYLLKPVSPGELASLIDRLAREMRADLLRLNEEFEGRVGSLLHGTLSLDGEGVEFVSGAGFIGALLVFDSALGEARLAEKQRECCGEIRARMATALEKGTRIALVTLPVGQIALICAWMPGADGPSFAESLRGFLRRVGSLLDSSAGPETRVTRIVCGDSPSFENLLERLGRAAELAPLRIALGIGRQIGCIELEEAGSGGREAFCSTLSEMAQAYRAQDRLEYLALLDRAERALNGVAEADRDTMEGPVSRFLTAAVGASLKARLGDGSWHESLRNIGESLRIEDRTAGAGELAGRVVDFVKNNYMRDIGIGQIASHLGVTPNYLSSVFHREKGATFLKYLTGLRMGKARAMLEAPGALVQDVARAVGYSSVRHFSRLFQRHFGLYPSDVPRVEKNTRGS
jgi:two-component system response regulator YesN